MTKAARALAEDYRQQAMQIQAVADTDFFITAVGFVDQNQYCFQFPKTLLQTHENLAASLFKARAACHEMGDMLEQWASDIERAVFEAVNSAASPDTRLSRRSHPY